MADIDPLLAERTGQTLAELQELKEIFQLVDLDHGGTISRSELETLMKTVGLSTSNNDMQLLMSEIDPTGSGEIDFEAFVLCVTKKVESTITPKQLRHAFSVLDQYDECHDGTISMKCLFQAFTKWSPAQMSEEDARELIKEVAPQSETQFFDYQQFLSIYFGDA
ncbi:Calmodulin-3 [Kappamyces sp. JEL0829]|nr:Calmodulin-3 [Kappamyces sp. JEL0829]